MDGSISGRQVSSFQAASQDADVDCKYWFQPFEKDGVYWRSLSLPDCLVLLIVLSMLGCYFNLV
jgi:hypothetical protein